jgi:hypothetical protein
VDEVWASAAGDAAACLVGDDEEEEEEEEERRKRFDDAGDGCSASALVNSRRRAVEEEGDDGNAAAAGGVCPECVLGVENEGDAGDAGGEARMEWPLGALLLSSFRLLLAVMMIVLSLAGSLVWLSISVTCRWAVVLLAFALPLMMLSLLSLTLMGRLLDVVEVVGTRLVDDDAEASAVAAAAAAGAGAAAEALSESWTTLWVSS